MGITAFSKPVETSIIPTNYDFLANLQRGDIGLEAQLQQQEQGLQANLQNQQLQQEEMIKKRQYDDFLQGEALANASNMLLGSTKAYGAAKQARLNQIRNIYGTALQSAITKVDGDYSKLLPQLKQLYNQLDQQVKFGEIGQMQTEYNKALENATEVDKMYRKGKYTDYDYMNAQQDLLNPISESYDIGTEMNKFLEKADTETMDYDLFKANAKNYADNNPEIQRQLARAKEAGPEYYQRELSQIENVVNNKYRMAREHNGSGSGGSKKNPVIGQSSTGTIDFEGGSTINDGSWFFSVGKDSDEDVQKIMPRTPGTNVEETRQIVEQADEALNTQAFDYGQFSSTTQDQKTKEFRPTLSGKRFFSLDGDNKSGEFNDYYDNLSDKEKKQFDDGVTGFKVVGKYKNNPYAPNAVIASATIDGKQKYFVVEDVNTGRDDITTSLFIDTLNPEYRKNGETPWHTTQELTQGTDVMLRAIPKVSLTDSGYKWTYDIELKGYDASGKEEIKRISFDPTEEEAKQGYTAVDKFNKFKSYLDGK